MGDGLEASALIGKCNLMGLGWAAAVYDVVGWIGGNGTTVARGIPR